MKISFFPVPQHRVFQYKPRFYNEKEDEMKKRYEKYGKDYSKASEPYRVSSGQEAEAGAETERKYVPGEMIRGSFKSSYETSYRRAGDTPIRKIVVILGVIAAIFAAYYLAQGLGVFINSI